jgi:4-amino-4-deoxy-L-arabinose transferase-like glycosyltransferase
MVSYKILGVSDWAARVPSAVLASLTIFAIYGFMRRFRPGSQLDAAVIASSVAGVIGFARAASTDMPLTAMFTIAMLGWYGWFETRTKLWLAEFYVFLALATLAKGPVALFLAAAIIFIFVALRREWRLILQTLWVPGVLLYVVVAMPWFVLVQRANPQFLHVFIFEHNLARYGTNMFQHKQPFWYFVPVALLALLPWVVIAVCATIRAIREAAERRSSFELYFVIWGLFPVIFFSFSQSKLPGYILPVIPGFAILTAEYLWRRIDEGDQLPLWLTSLHAFAGGALLSFALLSAFLVAKAKMTPTAIFIAIFAGIVIFTGILIAVYAKTLTTIRLATLVPVVLGLTFVIKMVTPEIDRRDSERPVAQRLAAYAKPATSVAVADVPRVVEYGLNFYRNQPISNYQRGEIPDGDHVVVGRPGAIEVIQSMAKGRKIIDAGGYQEQGLEFYLVRNADATQ